MPADSLRPWWLVDDRSASIKAPGTRMPAFDRGCLRDAGDPDLPHRIDELLDEQRRDVSGACVADGAEPIEVRPTGERHLRPQSDRPQDVEAGADAAVEEDGRPSSDAL